MFKASFPKAGFFAQADEGVTAIAFALAVLPVMLVVGAAIDYNRVVGQRVVLQSTADAVALTLAERMQPTSTGASLSAPAANSLSAAASNSSASLSGRRQSTPAPTRSAFH